MALLCGVLLTACGAGAEHNAGGDRPDGPSHPSAAHPLSATATAWPFLGGPSHFGGAGSVGPTRARIAWRRNLGAPVVAGPVVQGQIAYVAGDNGILHALEVRTGAALWSFDAHAGYGSDLSTGVTVLGSGEILWPGPDHRLYALTRGGRLLWSLAARAQVTTPVFDPAARLLVVADQSGQISGYRLHGTRRAPRHVWSRRLAAGSYGSPVVAANGEIYETAGDGLFALAPSGRVSWSVSTPDEVEVSPAVATNGIVVFGSNDREEWGIDPDGRVRWREKIGNYTYSSPLALSGKRLIYGNHSGQMTLLDTDTGNVIRRYQASGELWTAAAVDRAGDVYFATRLGSVDGFDAHGRRLFDLDTGGRFDSYPALAADGTLLVGDDDGVLYAIR
jgi:outer membrane protein assembly factor BamB